MNRQPQLTKVSVLFLSILGLGACGGGGAGGAGGAGGNTTCLAGDEGCVCYPNKTCNGTLSCLSNLCVAAGPSGGAGGAGPAAGGIPGSGGAGSGGSPDSGGAVASGGAPGSGGIVSSGGAPGSGGAVTSGGAPGSGGAVASGGTPGAGGTIAAGGAPGSGGSVSLGGVPGSGGITAPGGSTGNGGAVTDGCNNASASVLDNFATCDASICNLGGRVGTWFSYSSNTNIGIQCSATVPPISWIDRGCGYYCTNGVAGATWAGAGFNLKDPAGAYNLSSYAGVYVRIETGQSITVAIQDLAGGMWRSAPIGGGSGAVTHTIPFGTMTPDSGTTGAPNLAQIVGFRFDVDPKILSSFGFVIHTVTLY